MLTVDLQFTLANSGQNGGHKFDLAAECCACHLHKGKTAGNDVALEFACIKTKTQKRRPKTEDLRPCGLKRRPTSLKPFFHQATKRDKLDSYFISFGTIRVKLRDAVIFQQKYKNIIYHDDLVYFVVTNILFLKCTSENYDEVTSLPCYILSLSY